MVIWWHFEIVLVTPCYNHMTLEKCARGPLNILVVVCEEDNIYSMFFLEVALFDSVSEAEVLKGASVRPQAPPSDVISGLFQKFYLALQGHSRVTYK